MGSSWENLKSWVGPRKYNLLWIPNPFLSCDIDFPIFGICSHRGCPKQKVFQSVCSKPLFHTWVWDPIFVCHVFLPFKCTPNYLLTLGHTSNVVPHQPSDHITIILNHFTSPNSTSSPIFSSLSFFIALIF